MRWGFTANGFIDSLMKKLFTSLLDVVFGIKFEPEGFSRRNRFGVGYVKYGVTSPQKKTMCKTLAM